MADPHRKHILRNWVPRGPWAPAAALALALAQVPARAQGVSPDSTASGAHESDSLQAIRPAAAAAPSTTSASPTLASPPAPRNLLPFAQNELPTSYPRVSVSIGMAWYAGNFRRVEEAFHKSEEAFIAQGFDVSATEEDVSPGALVLTALTVWIHPSLDVAFQGGQTSDPHNQLTLFGVLASGHYTPGSARNVSLSLGVGGGKTAFAFKRVYDASGPNGEVLENISFDGGSGYWTGAAAFTLGTGPHGALQALVQYVGAKDVSTDTTDGRVTLNTSGTILGASLVLFF